MNNKKTKKVFISHNYQDNHKVNLLKAQLAGSDEIEVTWVEQSPIESTSEQEIQSLINKQISSSSMMLVLIGENWSRWQEYELNNAIQNGIPVAGLLSHGNDVVESTLLKSGEIPLVYWNWKDLSAILSGMSHTLDYSPETEEIAKSPIIQLDFSKISEELTQYLIQNPNAMYELSPRKFEELVAYLMEKHGYEVELTKQSRDGGIDIFALKRDIFGSFLTIVDCKKYSASNPIGVGVVRTMYGILNVENASHGMIATTSRFTKDAQGLAEEYKYQLSLKDHADIIKWIESTKSNNAN